MVCSFLVSGALHEAVGFVAMRRTLWPFNTLFLAMSASMTPWWDVLFPVLLSPAPAAAGHASAGGTAVEEEAVVVVVGTAAVTAASRRSAAGEAYVDPDGSGNDSDVHHQYGEQSSVRHSLSGESGENAAFGTPGIGTAEELPEGSLAVGKPPGGAVGVGVGPCRRRLSRPPIGGWRGWTAVVFYMVASVPLTLVVDYLLWQWWRHAHLTG